MTIRLPVGLVRGQKGKAMKEMGCIYSKEYGEEIEYYVDDLNYSYVVMGCGLNSGKPYNITFDEAGDVEEIEKINE